MRKGTPSRTMSASGLMACALIAMTCTTAEDSIQNAPNLRGTEVEQCQYREFSRRRDDCNKDMNFLSARKGNDCHIMQVYVDCVTLALRTTGCTKNPFFISSQSNLMRTKVADKKLSCDFHSDVLMLQADAEHSCLRVRAVKLFFKCGAAFHVHMEGKSLPPATICELLKAYADCGQVALKDTNCTKDGSLKAHMEYFLTQSLKRHSVRCPNTTIYNVSSRILKGSAGAVSEIQHWAMAYSEDGRADVHPRKHAPLMKQTKECLVEDALRRYFTCGSNFLWKMVIWKRHFAKHQDLYNLAENDTIPSTPSLRMLARRATENDEVCGAIKELHECTNEIVSRSDCKNPEGLSAKMITMQEMLVGEASKSACKFLPKTKHGVYPYYSKQNLPPPGCSYRKLVKLFSYCVVNFFSSFAMSTDDMQACLFVGRHGSCVEQARKSTNCSMKVKELEDFVYLTSVVQDKYSSRCKTDGQKTLAEKKAEAGVPSLCKKKSLLQRYLKCSHTLQDRLSAKVDECRALDSFSQCFMEARADNECTFTEDSFTSIMQMQAELMTDTLRSRCTQPFDLNVLLKCAQHDALKKVLLCGLSYNKLMEDLKRQGEYYVTATTCSYLAEYQHCIVEVERSTGCTKSTLHEHTSAILNFWTWNVAPLCESAASLLLTDVDPKCDSPKALLKAIKCTMEFQEYAEQAAWDTMTTAESCSSLEMLDRCLSSSLDIGQCKHSLNAKAQVSALRSLLVSEYRVACRKIYLSAPGMPGMRLDDYVYDDYYYFGDEVLRTKPPEKKPAASGEAHLRNEPLIASARSKLTDELKIIFNKMRGMGFEKILSKVKPDLGHAVVEEITAAAPSSILNSSDEYPLQSLMTGAVIPVMDTDYATCDVAGYQKERQRCTQYIADQADKYKMNIKYIPVSNLRDITDTVCRMVDLYRACMSEVAKRNKCLAMLANTPRIVESQLTKLGLTFCNSATLDSGCAPRYNAMPVTVALLSGICLKMIN